MPWGGSPVISTSLAIKGVCYSKGTEKVLFEDFLKNNYKSLRKNINWYIDWICFKDTLRIYVRENIDI